MGRIFAAFAIVYRGSIFISNDSVIVIGLLKLVSLLGFPVLLFALNFFEPEEIQKLKEIFKIAPRYAKM